MKTSFLVTNRFAGALLTVVAFALVLLASTNSFAHQGEPPRFLKASFEKTAAKDELMLASIDAAALRAETRAKRSSNQAVTKTLEYAKADDVSVTPATHGYWVTVDGGRVWRLRITAPGATDLNLGFTSYFMPKGATLHVYDPASQYFQGPYSAEHNFDHGQLWTPLTPGSQVVVEVFVPTGLEDQLVLQLGRVGKGYQNVFEIGLGALIKQGSCNIDVVCSEGDGWRDEIRSVAVYGTSGSTFCTGTLINNVEQDLIPFFLTADHCGVGSGNAASVVTYWNFESPTCGQLSGGSLSQNTSGATFRADDAPNDMTLLELSAQPDPSYNVHYAGWDARASLNPSGSVGIHHPNTDEKAISFNDDSMATTSSCIAASAPTTHWNVDNWEQGTTEPGSSGSALFDPATQRVIGYLSGGSASCSNTGGFDCYGKFSAGWSLGLSTWLDPNSTGVTVIDGIDPGTPPTGNVEVTRPGDRLNNLAINDQGEWLYGRTEMPSGVSQLRVRMQDAQTGDPDLYTRFAQQPNQSTFDCRPFQIGVTPEDCVTPNPQQGDHFWGLRADAPFTGVSLVVDAFVEAGDFVTGINESVQGEWSIYKIVVPAGTTNLSFLLDPEVGDDPDLFVRFGAAPTSDNYDCRPFLGSGSNETCDFANPQAGTYYVGINAFSTYQNASLRVSGDVPGSDDDILDFMPAIISAALNSCEFPKIGDSGTISGDISAADLISTTDKFIVGTNADYYFWQPKSSSRTVTLSSSQIDTFLAIRRGCDPDGPVLFFNDDDGISLNSKLELEGLSGNYLIEVTTFARGQFGPYQLSY